MEVVVPVKNTPTNDNFMLRQYLSQYLNISLSLISRPPLGFATASCHLASFTEYYQHFTSLHTTTKATLQEMSLLGTMAGAVRKLSANLLAKRKIKKKSD